MSALQGSGSWALLLCLARQCTPIVILCACALWMFRAWRSFPVWHGGAHTQLSSVPILYPLPSMTPLRSPHIIFLFRDPPKPRMLVWLRSGAGQASPCSCVRNGFGVSSSFRNGLGVASSFLGLWTLGMESVSSLLICPLQICGVWVVVKLLVFFLKRSQVVSPALHVDQSRLPHLGRRNLKALPT